jgi:hypothetical protein
MPQWRRQLVAPAVEGDGSWGLSWSIVTGGKFGPGDAPRTKTMYRATHHPARRIMRKPLAQTVFLGTAIIIVLGTATFLAFLGRSGQVDRGSGAVSSTSAASIPFDGDAAYEMLLRICALGKRYSGSPAMSAQQQLLGDYFRKIGGQVTLQPFAERHPETGERVVMNNLIVQWHPNRMERVLLCAHYDTRPYPDQDPVRPRGDFLGANDGASGVALLCELGKQMPQLISRYGVDFVLFDGEEFIFDAQRDRDRYFLGSSHFAREYVANPPPHRYRYGILLDMIGDASLELFYEKNSMRHARPLVLDIWKTAKRLGVTEFKPRSRHDVRDDHLPLNQIAKIPTCDIIDFDYPRPGAHIYWHTEADTPDKCAPESLAKVGWVVLEWLRKVE